MLGRIFGIVLAVTLCASSAFAQTDGKLIWRLDVNYFWGGGTAYIALQPGGTITFPGDAIGMAYVSDLTLMDRGQDLQVTATFRTPFDPTCKAEHTSFTDFAAEAQSSRKYRGTILKILDPGQGDPCLKISSDITFAAETFRGPSSWGTTSTKAPFNIRRGGSSVLPKGDIGPFVLVDGDNIATGAGGEVSLANQFGAQVIVREQTNLVVFRQGGLIHRPSGHADSRVEYLYNRQAQDPVCAAPDSCIIIAVPPSTYRVSSDRIHQCVVGPLCQHLLVTLTDATTLPASITDSPQAIASEAKISVVQGSGEIVDGNGGIRPVVTGETVTLNPTPATIVAAVAPASRSVQVPTPATAFATILNAGPGPAFGCRITLDETQPLPVLLDFWTTDPATNAIIGERNAAIDLPSPPQGKFSSQTFVFSLKPSGPFSATDVRLNHTCNGSQSVTQLVGINTLLLSASNNPVPDHIAVGLTPSNDAVVRIPGTGGTNIFVIAATNIGVASATTARVRLSDPTMPVSVLVCETNPSDGQCKQTPSPTLTRTINNNENTTWTAFVTANGPLALDPAKYRAFFEFLDSGGVIRGSTSAAVMVQ